MPRVDRHRSRRRSVRVFRARNVWIKTLLTEDVWSGNVGHCEYRLSHAIESCVCPEATKYYTRATVKFRRATFLSILRKSKASAYRKYSHIPMFRRSFGHSRFQLIADRNERPSPCTMIRRSPLELVGTMSLDRNYWRSDKITIILGYLTFSLRRTISTDGAIFYC